MSDVTPPPPPAEPDPAAGAPQQPAPGQQQPPTPPQYAQQQPSTQPPGGAPLTREQDIQWASFAHLGGVIGFLPSLIIWLVFKDRGQFTNTEAKEALNFQITMTGAYIILWILVAIVSIATFGIGAVLGLLLWVPWILSVIFSIIAFLQVKDGKHYRYPFAVRLIK